MVEIDSRPAAPDGVAAAEWVRCAKCTQLVYGKRFARTLQVCPDCGDHARLTARERLDQLLDPGSDVPLDAEPTPHDPLDFVDARPYPERLAEARAATGMSDAALAVRGRIDGRPVVAAAMDFRFLGGSLGCAVGALIARAARESLRERIPLLIVSASGGARMQEGALSLMQMAKTAAAIAELDEAGILVVSLVTDPTYGGVAASFASLADVILIEPGARMGFAGPRVIEQTIGEQLPEGFQTAEFLLAHGLVDAVVPRAQLRRTLGHLLGVGCAAARGADGTGNGSAYDTDEADGPRHGDDGHDTPEFAEGSPNGVRPAGSGGGASTGHDPWETVRLARHPARPTALCYANRLLEDFHELHGDRIGSDCPAVVGGLGILHGQPVVLIGHQKGGDDLAERQRRHFGMATPAGFRKAARLMRLAAKLGLPVVTLVDTPGANPGPDAERGGQAIAIAENLQLMSGLPVPIVTVVTGEGGSGGALALAVADRVLISERGVYSVISPEGCAAILWKDPAAAPVAAAALRMGPGELLDLGIVDAVVPEPPGGAHTDPDKAAELLGDALRPVLEELRRLTPERLIRERRNRYHRFGTAPDRETEVSPDASPDASADPAPEPAPAPDAGPAPEPAADAQPDPDPDDFPVGAHEGVRT
ncbi:acetyl-CoA carboxylase, carboxyltransferase subunit beta [Yinghuangia seranimata]|uniref:acetyl-CoA carboxylase, carboxyltransferase subunit beta n=1 Tax=Yinghuangia seranimata TaxID=408067 RepID=UPI00248BB1D9|nr:acetyl-CoA carboxylase, carboxyltransferase subunit beta [Yinghuangia seranimata]MDI2128990.1 acetyl-CoA carboxylase, carboxyltransferase subunit beta [Yinghuangia seranimata]